LKLPVHARNFFVRCCQRAAGLLASILVVFWPLMGSAEVVKNLYEALVPVADHSESALASASELALSQVLVKVSGSVEVLQNPDIVTGLSKARSYVQQYSYTRDQDATGDLSARLEFDESVVSRMLTDAGAPLWTANRPAVLVWVVSQDAGGRQFVNPEAAPELMTTLRGGFDQRGIPLRFPLLDLQDSASLAVDDVWRLKAAPLYSASQRYAVQDILAGRLTSLSNGSWVGDWSYLTDSGRVDRSVTADSIETFLASGVSLVAEEMAGRYAVAASRADVGGIVMSVTGVADFGDYAKIVSWLEGLELIQHANIETVRGSDIELRLTARADAGQLRPIIELNDRLSPTSPDVPSGELSYQWQN
jgi:uncharacterized protein